MAGWQAAAAAPEGSRSESDCREGIAAKIISVHDRNGVPAKNAGHTKHLSLCGEAAQRLMMSSEVNTAALSAAEQEKMGLRTTGRRYPE
jgi:hypothetical protein